TAEGGESVCYHGPRPDVVTFPAPGVVDPARRAVLGLQDMPALLHGDSIEDLRLVTPSRPDADVARIICRTSDGDMRKRVDFFCPHWAEIWGPDALTETGCGGSEEAVIYLTRELAKIGYEPHVYGPWRPPGGLEVRDGVWWHDIRSFSPSESTVPLIAHRAPWILKDLSLASRPVYVWHHDHEYPDDNWTLPIVQRARHLFVSRWQQEGLSRAVGLQPEGLYGVVVGNGIPREEYDLGGRAAPPREHDRVFFASQPQRGLLPLLQAWPLVLAQEPGAVLDVYYGWQTVEALARTSQPQLWDIIRETDRLLRETPRVNAVGRLPQTRLAEAMMRAGVWAYPCIYPEVSAIIGMRAAAAGCKLVYTKTAALPETMPDNAYALEPEGLTTEAFAAMVVTAIRDKSYPAEHVARMTLSTCSWSVVAGRVADALEGRT
ncbi:MAG: glycosyltransferase family 4 protein, partial [Dehalococcoidia bacterium]|nr:glycosyltransferase family 4 protein [Dehalococcoidia bacterium]